MSHSSRSAAHRNARDIADAAMTAYPGAILLSRCRALLAELDPARPPAKAHSREFQWQYRALKERVHLYERRLAGFRGSDTGVDTELRKMELAIERCLQYFHDVLSMRREDDGG